MLKINTLLRLRLAEELTLNLLVSGEKHAHLN